MTVLIPLAKVQIISQTGEPLVGGKIYTYIPGTLTFKDTYQDDAGTILNTNPIILDARGEALIYGIGAYRQIVKDSLDNTIWDEVAGSDAPVTFPNASVASRAELRALDTAVYQTAYLSEDGRFGHFAWRNGNYSVQIAADTLEGVYIKADAVAATLGAWVRQYAWSVETAWFGAVGDDVTDDGPALDTARVIAMIENVGIDYSGSVGNIFKRTTQHVFDFTGDDAGDSTAGIIIRGRGTQRSLIDVRTVATDPQAKFIRSGGFSLVNITSISGTGTVVTVSWANTITVGIGVTLEIIGSSIPGYNGNWTVLTAGPGTATFACTATGTPSPLGVISQHVIQANSYVERLGFLTNTTGVGLAIGSHDYAEQLNRTWFDLTVTNETNSATSCAVEINALYHCTGNINAVLGGTIVANSAAVRIRKAAFTDMIIGGGNGDRGTHITDNYVYGCTFTVPDNEIVNYGVVNDSIYCFDNTFIGGTIGHTTYGFISTAGGRNRILNPNSNSAAPILHPDPAFRVGLQLDRGEWIGYNGNIAFGNEFIENVLYNNTVATGQTIAAPADGIARVVLRDNSGTTNTLTVTLPVLVTGERPKRIQYYFVNGVTNLTMTGGTILGTSPTTVAGDTTLRFTYVPAASAWVKF